MRNIYIYIYYIILSHPLSLPAAQPPWSEACFQLPKTPKFHVTRSVRSRKTRRNPAAVFGIIVLFIVVLLLKPSQRNLELMQLQSWFFVFLQAIRINLFCGNAFFLFKVFEGCFTVEEMNFLAMAATHHKVSLCQNWAMVVFFFHLFPFQAVCSDFCEEIHIQIILTLYSQLHKQ